MRKTDDTIILQLLREGKSHAEIAKHFGVSRPAISKRVKILNPKPDLSHLTAKERDFVEEIAKGSGHIEAAMKSYNAKNRKNAASIGLDLMKQPKITNSIEALMEYNGLSRDYRIKKLKQHTDHPDPHVSLKAIAEANKMDGSYAPSRNVNLNLDAENFHPVDLSLYRNQGTISDDAQITDAEIVEKGSC